MAIDIDEMRRKAEAGSAVSRGILGGLLLYGEEGVPVDYTEAFKWLSLAASEGAFLPIAHLGYMYEQGLGVPQDMDEAVRLYKDSARRGNSGIAYDLAQMYSEGRGVPVDPGEAVHWYAVCYENTDESQDTFDEIEKRVSQLPGFAQTLRDILESDPLFLARAGAAKMLGTLEVVSAIPALMKAAKTDSHLVKRSALVGLSYFEEWNEAGIPDKEAVTEFLLRFSHDDDDEIRSAAISSLYFADHDADRTYERLLTALDDPSSLVRGTAAYGLTYYEEPEIVKRLDSLLRNDIEPHEMYFDAVTELGDPSLLPAVLIAAERWRSQQRRYQPEYPGIPFAIQRLTEGGKDNA